VSKRLRRRRRARECRCANDSNLNVSACEQCSAGIVRKTGDSHCEDGAGSVGEAQGFIENRETDTLRLSAGF